MTGAMLSPRIDAMTAEMAPSVARMGATTPTLPMRKANPATRMPTTLPTPAMTIHGVLAPRFAGMPEMPRKGRVMMRPTSMVQATDEPGPMILTVREEIRLLLAKKAAVSRPATTLTTQRTLSPGFLRRGAGM